MSWVSPSCPTGSKDLCANLAQAEQNEAAAAQALAQANQTAAQRIAEAQEQARCVKHPLLPALGG